MPKSQTRNGLLMLLSSACLGRNCISLLFWTCLLYTSGVKVSINSSLPLRSAPCLCATGTRRPFQRFAVSKGRFSPAGSVGVQRLPLASNTLWPLSAESGILLSPKAQEGRKKRPGDVSSVGNPRRGFPVWAVNRHKTHHKLVKRS